ncbi:hypothetical protein BDV28DRAFT_151234 [Aspergillus coremiiformis]|uniref:Uncharacterized protein n=1 Tax=Aspergillus coremiiformis TaxID=138285 RepID=A0A5N6YXG4_9EURO|nr:hypothetical protein BDV28DRAFT_151234 [Aspergillus coremiiformis]
MTKGGRYRRRQAGYGPGARYPAEHLPPNYVSDGSFLSPPSSTQSCSIPLPPGFAPVAHDGLPPSSILRPQVSGPPTPAWSPGPIPDFYSPHEEPGMRGRNQTPQIIPPMQPAPLLQSPYANQHDRSVQPSPLTPPMKSYMPVQPVQPMRQYSPIHTNPPSHSTRSGQYNLFAQPPPHPRSVQPVPRYQYQPVAVPVVVPVVSYYPGAHTAYGRPQLGVYGVAGPHTPKVVGDHKGSQLRDPQLRGDAPEFFPTDQRRTEPREHNWMVVTSP